MHLGEARVPDGLRLYAIGDVHGCDDLLDDIHARIAADIAGRTSSSIRIVHLGDYADRGPQTADVIERLSRLRETDDNVICLRGNHEHMLLEFLDNPHASGVTWLSNGGENTLRSYDIDLFGSSSIDRRMIAISRRFAEAIPAHHHHFLNTLEYSVHFGDYFFCHAGIRPGIPLDQQDPTDLIWIRDHFLESDADFGAVVVHGHTPVEEPEIRPNRINIDTGAVFGGALTCLILEGNEYRFL